LWDRGGRGGGGEHPFPKNSPEGEKKTTIRVASSRDHGGECGEKQKACSNPEVRRRSGKKGRERTNDDHSSPRAGGGKESSVKEKKKKEGPTQKKTEETVSARGGEGVLFLGPKLTDDARGKRKKKKKKTADIT